LTLGSKKLKDQAKEICLCQDSAGSQLLINENNTSSRILTMDNCPVFDE